MSYCRFSSGDSPCDVYVYEDFIGGWTTHVAWRRCVLKELLHPGDDIFGLGHWGLKLLDDANWVKIGLPHDGDTLHNETAEECADRLEELREMGYRVPQSAIDALREEAGEP